MSARYISERDWEASKPWVSDKISVHNLKTAANAGFDAWGRPKVQPVEITITVGLKGTVSTAAAGDALNESTVHYGNLSKTVLAKMPEDTWLLPDAFLHELGTAVKDFASTTSTPEFIEVVTRYPKSSLLGDGFSLTLSHNLSANNVTSVVFRLQSLRIPALIGVNEHERRAKQCIVVNAWIDRLRPHMSNECYKVEQLIVKTIEESAFETLESLCESIAAKIIKYFIIAKQPLNTMLSAEPAGVRVRIEKPMAVPLADAPAVEVYRSAQPDDPFGRRMYAELGNKRPQIPFPLEGRLDEFLQAWKQD